VRPQAGAERPGDFLARQICPGDRDRWHVSSFLSDDYDESAVTLVKGIKIAQSIGFTLSELGPIAAADSAGSLDDRPLITRRELNPGG
jgi:hypothetical protein